MIKPRQKIEYAEPANLSGVKSFYLKVGYGCDVHPGDRLLVATLDQSIVAAARLCTEDGTLVLRGMYVDEEHQGQGIGARLLYSLSAMIGSSECWCIPFSHLTNFYSRIGFEVCEGEETPQFLSERWERYKANGQKVVIMKKPPS